MTCIALLSLCLSWRTVCCSTCLTPVSLVRWRGLWEMLFCPTVNGTHSCFRETDHPPFCGSTSQDRKSFCTIRKTSEGLTYTHCLSGASRPDQHNKKPAQVSSFSPRSIKPLIMMALSFIVENFALQAASNNLCKYFNQQKWLWQNCMLWTKQFYNWVTSDSQAKDVS